MKDRNASELYVISTDYDSQNQEEQFELMHPYSGSKWKMEKTDLIYLLMHNNDNKDFGDLVNTDKSSNATTKQALNKWIENNWFLSVPLYMAFKMTKFLDVGMNAKELRIENLEKYVSEEALPMPAYSQKTISTSLISQSLRRPEISIGEMLTNRHSVSAPSSKGMDVKIIHSILNESIHKIGKLANHLARNGSAVALSSYGSSFDLYITVYEVEGLNPGIYRIRPESMQLDLIKSGTFRKEMSRALIGQEGPKISACTISIVGDFERQMWRYRHERALPLLWIDAARLMSSLIWSSTAHQLRMQISPAVMDEIFLDFFSLPKDMSKQCLYNISLGQP